MEEDASEFDESFREKLELFRVDIVQTIDLERQLIFSYLRSNSVLDEEDCEMIMSAGAGRKQKVAKFLDVLARKGSEGYRHFVDSLEKEYPHLFQKITGKSAQKNANPVDSLDKFKLYGGGLAEKEWVDFDRQYLSQQLENTTTDLQMLTYLHNKIVHEKNALEKNFLKATNALQDQQQQVEDLREQLEVTKTMPAANHTKPNESSRAVQKYIQELMAENADKSNRIIFLQQSLLDAVGNAEKNRLSYIELQRRHEEVLQQLRDVTINYDWERRNSRRMTEKMRKQTDQIKQGEDLHREIFNLKLRISEMQEQRDEAREELREFRNVTEALNAKFDSVRQEKDQAVEFQEVCSSTVFELRKKEGILQSRLQEAYLDLNDVKRKNMRLTQENQTLRDQRDVLLQEREMTISERNSAVKERDEAMRLKKELQESRDEAIEAQLRINKVLHDDYCKLHEEMDVVRKDLRMITEQNERQRLKLREYENANQIAPVEITETVEQNTTSDDVKSDGVDGQLDGRCEEKQEETKTPFRPFPWRKERSSTAILNSAYRRLQHSDENNFQKHRGSVPAVLESISSGELQLMHLNIDVKEAKQGSKTTIETPVEPRARSHNLKIDVTAARALSRSCNALTDINDKSEGDARMVERIVPAMSDLSIHLAMKTGSHESLAGKERSSSPSDFLKSPEGKRGHLPLKSVSPKILYKVDQQASSVFSFTAQMKPKEHSFPDTNKAERANSETSIGVNQDPCGKQGKKAKSANKQKAATLKNTKCADISRVFLTCASTHRRRHSSGDLAVLTHECNSSSDV